MHRTGRFGPIAFILVLLALAMSSGCGGGDGTTATTASAGEVPRRIVSLSATATEDLFAIGAGDQVTAVDDESDYPPSAPVTELSGFQPNVEAIAAYRPDLVVAAGEGTAAAVRGLRKLGIRVLVQLAATSFSQAYDQILELGRITGHERRARALVASIRERISRALREAPSGRGLTVYHELSPDYFTADSTTFIGRVYRLFGLANIADGAATAAGTGYPQLSAEYVVSASPDLVFLADSGCCGQSAATVRRRPGWSGVSAIRNGGVVVVNEDVASRWGPRIPEFAERVSEAISAVRGANGE